MGTNAGKKRGQGKAKGIKAGDGEIEVEIYDGKIITPKHTPEITILFHKKLNGAWTTFTEYPNSELETLYAQYRAQRFKHKQPDEEVKKAFVELVKHCYSDWMFCIRNPIFRSTKRKKIVTRMVLPSFLPLFGKRWGISGWQEIGRRQV